MQSFEYPYWSAYQKYFKTPIWLDDIMQRAFGGIEPFNTPVERVQLIVKTLESSMQVGGRFGCALAPLGVCASVLGVCSWTM